MLARPSCEAVAKTSDMPHDMFCGIVLRTCSVNHVVLRTCPVRKTWFVQVHCVAAVSGVDEQVYSCDTFNPNKMLH